MYDAALLAMFGMPELLLIAGIVILLFGASRLPQIGRGLGEGIREFKRSLSGEDEEERRKMEGGGEDRRDSDRDRR